MSPDLKELLERCKLETADQVHAHVAKTRMYKTKEEMLTELLRSYGFTNKKQESNGEMIRRALEHMYGTMVEETRCLMHLYDEMQGRVEGEGAKKLFPILLRAIQRLTAVHPGGTTKEEK